MDSDGIISLLPARFRGAAEALKNELFELRVFAGGGVWAEANIESLIKAKGFAECVVMIGDDGVKVMVQSAGLLPAKAAQIAEIVTSETGEELSRVRIVEVK